MQPCRLSWPPLAPELLAEIEAPDACVGFAVPVFAKTSPLLTANADTMTTAEATFDIVCIIIP